MNNARNLPPLIVAALAMCLLLALLPSALSLPQVQPSEQLEFAPVPPQDSDASPGGNFASLGLGSSSSIGGSNRGPGAPSTDGSGAGGGVGKSPSTKRCVGSPPRQTEDPLSPPCVAFFDGDNGGATWRGVTADEVRVVLYHNGGGRQPSGSGADDIPANTYFDLSQEPEGREPTPVRVARIYQRFFNERYQTYGRRVHFWVHFSSTSDGWYTPETRRADAADQRSVVDPFAVIDYSDTDSESYLQAMSRLGVLTIVGDSEISAGSQEIGQEAEQFRAYPGLMWSYPSSVEQKAGLFGDLLCSQVANRPVSFGGNGEEGRPRVFGLLHLPDTDRPEMQTYRRAIEQVFNDCGGKFVIDAPSLVRGQACAAIGGPDLANAIAEMSSFRDAGVTTVVWAGGFDSCKSHAAAAIDWFPEWVIAPDAINDNNYFTRLPNGHESSVWRHARLATPLPRADGFDDQHCFRALRETDLTLSRFDANVYACPVYTGIRQLFNAVQVAGPRLSPRTVDRGFHAIPPVDSTDPTLPACFYEPGDYTCVKDMQVQWWDPEGVSPGTSERGCWRMMEGGRRFRAGRWPEVDIDSRRRPGQDLCNYQGTEITS